MLGMKMPVGLDLIFFTMDASLANRPACVTYA